MPRYVESRLEIMIALLDCPDLVNFGRILSHFVMLSIIDFPTEFEPRLQRLLENMAGLRRSASLSSCLGRDLCHIQNRCTLLFPHVLRDALCFIARIWSQSEMNYIPPPSP